MNHHTVKSYDEDLKIIRSSLLKMANLVIKMVSLSLEIFEKEENSYNSRAALTERKINQLDSSIDNMAITMLALRQPVANDLREIVGGLKLSVIFERMGDISKNIAKRISKTDFKISDLVRKQIKEMSLIVISMLSKAIDAYENSDLELCKEITLMDNEVDNLHNKLRSDLEKILASEPQNVHDILEYVFAVKNLERIGDYSAKVAIITYFIITGVKAPFADE